jgi:carbon-monoxide dehydrogenase small subunit
MKVKIQFEVNGIKQDILTYPMERLLDVLRSESQFTGTKEGCGEGECGACSVWLDGKLVNSCLVPVAQVQGAKITTVEGLAQGQSLHPVQQAFLECGGAQCGICTPGMIMASCDLLKKNPRPTRHEITEALAGNLCRCTGFMKIIDAVENAAKIMSPPVKP